MELSEVDLNDIRVAASEFAENALVWDKDDLEYHPRRNWREHTRKLSERIDEIISCSLARQLRRCNDSIADHEKGARPC
jgi:hypothetical protein